MKRTRKWAFVEQEAKRLAALGLQPIDIAKRLGVTKASVNRWMASGKLERRTSARAARVAGSGKSPGEWAATVRKDFALDATDEQLVTIGETALALSLDPSLAAHVRMNAAGRFQAIVRQLALVARKADEQPGDKPERPHVERRPEPVQRTGTDPRRMLMAVK